MITEMQVGNGQKMDGKHPFKRHKHSGLTSRSIRRMNSSKKKMLESVPSMRSKPRGFSL